jgi:hypothetical protein
VDDIVIMHRHLLQSLEEIAGKFNLAPAADYAAMAYYYDHRIEIDQQILNDDAFVELSKRQAVARKCAGELSFFDGHARSIRP